MENKDLGEALARTLDPNGLCENGEVKGSDMLADIIKRAEKATDVAAKEENSSALLRI